MTCQNAPCCKIQGTGKMVGDQHGWQSQTDGAPQNIEKIFPAGAPGLGILVMGDQRIGSQGEHLIKEIHG